MRMYEEEETKQRTDRRLMIRDDFPAVYKEMGFSLASDHFCD